MAKVCYVMTPAMRAYARENFRDVPENEVLLLVSLYNEDNGVEDMEALPPADGVRRLLERHLLAIANAFSKVVKD